MKTKCSHAGYFGIPSKRRLKGESPEGCRSEQRAFVPRRCIRMPSLKVNVAEWILSFSTCCQGIIFLTIEDRSIKDMFFNVFRIILCCMYECYVCMCVCMFVCIPHACLVPTKFPQIAHWIPRNWIHNDCEPSCGFWVLKPGPQQEQKFFNYWTVCLSSSQGHGS